MKSFSLTILGTNAAVPAYGRFLSSQVVEYNSNLFLVDAGEGSQIRMAEYKIKRNQIRVICISHLHGDHVFGLPGVITSFNHFDRASAVTVIGPVGLKKFLSAAFSIGNFIPRFDLHIIELSDISDLAQVWENHELSIFAFPLSHRIETYGYKFVEKLPKPNIRKEAIFQYQLTVEEIKSIKNGGNITRDGKILDTDLLIRPHCPLRSYAYCSDTKYDESIIPFINGVNVLYHETTYTHDLHAQAEDRGHSTGREAAIIATKAQVGTLITGHYSARYRLAEEPFAEAQSIFANTLKGYDGFMLKIQ